MLMLTCPNCGPRNVQEFRYGGENHPRPGEPDALDDGAWNEYLYMRDNRLGVQEEWWYHRAGCGLWFLATRHTKTGEVMGTRLWGQDADNE
jgi:heterotetrameric sarcosine oxidase delta subunit